VNTSLEHEYAGDVHDLSLFWWDSGTDYAGDDVLFPDTGYEWLPKMLATGLDVRLGHRVRRIEWSPAAGVNVVTDRGPFPGGPEGGHAASLPQTRAGHQNEGIALDSVRQSRHSRHQESESTALE